MQSHMVLFRAAIEDHGDHTPIDRTPSLTRRYDIPLRELRLIGVSMAAALALLGYASQAPDGIAALFGAAQL